MHTYFFSVQFVADDFYRDEEGTVCAADAGEAEIKVEAHYRPQFTDDVKFDIVIYTHIE